MTTITTIGIETMARMLGNVSPVAAFTYIATGTDRTAESSAHTQLISENTLYGAGRQAANVSFIGPGTTQWDKLFSFSGAVTINEVGIFNNASAGAGNMFSRSLIPVQRTFSSGEAVQITIQNVTTAI